MRLIDADALHDDFINDLLCIKFGAALQGTPRSDIDVSNVLERIEEAPTIEAQPVRHGKWVQSRSPGGSPLCNCSVCGDSAISQDNDWGDVIDYHETDFCPNCGAKMVGGDNST